jgi:hypothetical protein
MSETAIFTIGAVIFTITVYGSVMASMARTVTRLGTKENDPIGRPATASTAPPTEPGPEQ